MPPRLRSPIIAFKTVASATAKVAGAGAVLLFGATTLLPEPEELIINPPTTTILEEIASTTTSNVVETLGAVFKPTVSAFVSKYDYDAPSELALRLILYSVWIAALTMGLLGVLQGFRLGHQWLKSKHNNYLSWVGNQLFELAIADLDMVETGALAYFPTAVSTPITLVFGLWFEIIQLAILSQMILHLVDSKSFRHLKTVNPLELLHLKETSSIVNQLAPISPILSLLREGFVQVTAARICSQYSLVNEILVSRYDYSTFLPGDFATIHLFSNKPELPTFMPIDFIAVEIFESLTSTSFTSRRSSVSTSSSSNDDSTLDNIFDDDAASIYSDQSADSEIIEDYPCDEGHYCVPGVQLAFSLPPKRVAEVVDILPGAWTVEDNSRFYEPEDLEVTKDSLANDLGEDYPEGLLSVVWLTFQETPEPVVFGKVVARPIKSLPDRHLGTATRICDSTRESTYVPTLRRKRSTALFPNRWEIQYRLKRKVGWIKCDSAERVYDDVRASAWCRSTRRRFEAPCFASEIPKLCWDKATLARDLAWMTAHTSEMQKFSGKQAFLAERFCDRALKELPANLPIEYLTGFAEVLDRVQDSYSNALTQENIPPSLFPSLPCW